MASGADSDLACGASSVGVGQEDAAGQFYLFV